MVRRKREQENKLPFDNRALDSIQESVHFELIDQQVLNSYKDFHLEDKSIFCILSVNQLIASLEVGYLVPKDNVSWNDKLFFFPGQNLKLVKEEIGPTVYAKVPLEWILESLIDERNDVFVSTFDKIFPTNEIINFYLQQKDENEIKVLFETFNLHVKYIILNFESFSSPNFTSHYRSVSISPVFVDKLIGGINLSMISEIYGRLIDDKQIPFGNKYIEPFTSYFLTINNEKFKPIINLIGRQGFELLYSLESYQNNGSISDLNLEEKKYKDLLCSDFDILKDVRIELQSSLIWIIPLIIKYHKELSLGNAYNFQKELDHVLMKNSLSKDISTQWPIILFAGFSAKAINHDLWSNSQEGINKSGDFINLLKESVESYINTNYYSKSYLDATRSIYTSVRAHISSFQFQKVLDIANSLQTSKSNIFNDVMSALCILWATDTMSTDWYNVFNRAYNGKVNNTANLFPILGAWMGFYHGYKAINKIRLYNFSNSKYIDFISLKFIKNYNNLKNNNKLALTGFTFLKNISPNSQTRPLFIIQFNNGFELPIVYQSSKNTLTERKLDVVNKLKIKADDIRKNNLEIIRLIDELNKI